MIQRAMAAQGRQRFLEIRRQWRLGFDDLLPARMKEPQPAGVQPLAGSEAISSTSAAQTRHQIGQPHAVAAAVHLIGQHRAMNAGQVNANLMRPTRPRRDSAKAVASKSLQDLVEAASCLAPLFIVGRDHLDSIAGVLADPPFNVIAIAIGDSGGEGRVFLEDFLAARTEHSVRDASVLPWQRGSRRWCRGRVGEQVPAGTRRQPG